MKKITQITVVILFVISLACTTYAREPVTEVIPDYIGTYDTNEYGSISALVKTPNYNTVATVTENITVDPVEIPGNYQLPGNIQSSDEGVSPYVYAQISFSGLAGGHYTSDWIEYVIEEPGESKLHINTCTWIPARYEIVIGFYNTGTNRIYGVEYSNTTLSNVNIRTDTLPAGTYYIIVKNDEASNLIISDGILNYGWV